MAQKKNTQETITVGLKRKVQKVRISGVDFEINLGNKKIEEYRKQKEELVPLLEAYQKEALEAQADNDLKRLAELLEIATEKIKLITDLFLGTGAFDTLFEMADEDVFVVADAVQEVSDKFAVIQTKKRALSIIDGKK